MADILDIVDPNWSPRSRRKPRSPVREKTTKRANAKSPQIGPSVFDQIQGMLRHPEYRRCLQLWQEIFRKQDASLPLTPEEEAERDAPRTKFRLDAIAEADCGLLSQEKRKLSSMSETAWAFHSIPPPEVDQVMKTVTVALPLDVSIEANLERVKQVLEDARKSLGVVANQNIRRPEVNPWRVYDLRQDGLNLVQITHQLFGTKGSPAHDDAVNARYKQVSGAYDYAKRVMKQLDQQTATKKNG